VRQVLLNLLSNAIKYTQEGHISICVTGKLSADNEVTLYFEVSDTGIGIKEEDQTKLFINFTRLDALRNKNVEGTGLGLAISRGLCKMMGGDIKVVSEYGKGSVFTAVLPQKIKNPVPLAVVRDPETKRVLLFEDRILCADSILRSMNDLGVDCTLVSTEQEFAAALKSGNYRFLFAAEHLFEKIHEPVPKSELILLAEYGKTVFNRNVRSVTMPIHAILLANLLNGEAEIEIYGESRESAVRFICPAAKILIVDDITTNLKIAEGLLSSYKAQIDCCDDGMKAVELIRTNKYDVIMLDHMMPGMDGIEVTAAVRALPDRYFQQVPIIALTANAVSGMQEMFLENGFNDFLSKPIEIFKLNKIMSKWIPQEKREKPVSTVGTFRPDRESPFRVEGLDISYGITMTGGSAERYRKVLATYCKDVLKHLELLREMPDMEGLALFTTQVHAMKSASASIGATAISTEAAKLEEAGKNDDLAFIREHLTGFCESLKRLVTRIDTALENVE
jgi:CheY-like chemotaxis protein